MPSRRESTQPTASSRQRPPGSQLVDGLRREARSRGHEGATVGAGAGALLGAMLGSFLGPPGAVLGAAIGAGIGGKAGADVDQGRS